jgi:hypothetical protein
MPEGAVVTKLVSILDRRRDEIIRSVLDMREKGLALAAKDLVNGEGFSFAGRPYRLWLVDHTHQAAPCVGQPGPSTWAGYRTWQLKVRRDAATADTVIEWYRREGQRWMDDHIPDLAGRLGVQPGLIWRVRPYDGRRSGGGSWATYSPHTHTIAVHWMVFQFPADLVRHVAAHEVAHASLRHTRSGHGLRWQAKLSVLSPDWRDLETAARTAAGLTLWAGDVTTAPAAPAPVSGWSDVDVLGGTR